MPKSGLVRSARSRQERRRPAEMPNEVQGQLEELCHELAVQVKRMRQLQDQADELRTAMRAMAQQSEAGRTTNRSIVEDDAEK